MSCFENIIFADFWVTTKIKSLSGQMEIYTKENSKTIKEMEKEFLIGLMEINTKENR